MSRDLRTIQALVTANAEHLIRSRPYGQDGHLSQFECSCGQVFVPSPLAPHPSNAPSLPALHRSLVAARAAMSLSLVSLSEVADVIDGSVFLGRDGKLYRSLDGRQRWLAQDGRILEGPPADQTSLSLLWMPSPL